ncbi:MAG: HNH endonuclease signature motif containing protein [Gemmatimonadota bacterium]|nr:HNH endonuclease signature motif containing protein [Gemmatimonadota bacterium]
MSRHHARWAWHRASKAAKVRAGFRCERCGHAGRLQTHHKVPKWEGGDDSPENLAVLCGGCHLGAHRRLGRPTSREPDAAPEPRPRRGLSPDWRRLVEDVRRSGNT